MIARKLRAALLLSSLALLQQPAHAEDLPGISLEATTISQQINTVFTLAEQAYPELFGGASGWRWYEGFTFKYFAATGIYAGIKDGEVYLMGGAYGDTPVSVGDISSIITALEDYIAQLNVNPNTPTADFNDFLAARTVADLIQHFSTITLEYGSTGTSSQIKLELLGQETIGGVGTDQLQVSISGSGSSSVLVYDMWIDSAGTVHRVRGGNVEYTGTQAAYLGPLLITGFIAALASADQPQVKAALANERENPALSTKVTKRIVGDIEVDTLHLTIAANGGEINAYISDFGSFSLMTEYTAKVGAITTSLEIIDMKLR